MPLIVLGIIVVAAFLVLLYNTGDKDKKKIRARWMDVDPGKEIKKAQYKKSADGKVVYLYDEKEPKDGPPEDKK